MTTPTPTNLVSSTTPANIPLPNTPLHTEQGLRIWWRFWRQVATNANSGAGGGGNLAFSQAGEFEGQIEDLQARVRALEARTQLYPDQPASKTDVRSVIDSLYAAIEAVEKLIPAPNPGVFGALTVTQNGGLAFQGQTSDAGSSIGTLTNAPHAANPVFWLRAVVNGVQVTIPAWAA